MGRGHVEIGADLNPLYQALNNAQNKVQALGANLMRTGLNAIGAGVALATPLGLAVMQFATFEQSLANLRAAANPTTEEFGLLKKQIEEVALATGEMPADVAKVYTELVKGGKTASEVLGGLGEATVKFARVSELEGSVAAGVLIDAMNIFGVGASEAMNIMSQAADASTISLADVAMSFGRGGSAASLFGQNMTDVATAIALLGKAGIKGEDAGTMVKTMMSRIAAGSEDAQKGMQLLGLSLHSFRDASGKVLPLLQIIEVLRGGVESVGGLDSVISHTALAAIGGQRGIQGFAALLQGGSTAWSDMRKQMEGSLTVEQKFDIITNTLQGNFKRLLVGVSVVAIAIGEALEPALSAVGAVLGPVLAGIAEFIRNNQGLVMVVAAAAAALIAFGAALIFDGARVWLVGGAIGMVAKVVGGVLGLFRMLTASVGALSMVSTVASFAMGALSSGFGLFTVAGLLAKGVLWLWNGAVLIGKGVIWLYTAATGAASVAIATFASIQASAAAFGWLLTAALVAANAAFALYDMACAIATVSTTAATAGMNLLAGAIGIVTVAILAVPLTYLALATYQAVAASNALGRAWTATSNALGDAFDSTWERAKFTFGQITDTAKSALAGIRDAQKAGDWDLAWQIMVAGGKLAWFDIKSFAMDTFIDWKYAAIATFQAIGDAIRTTFAAIWSGIKVGFYDTILAIANAPGLSLIPGMSSVLGTLGLNTVRSQVGALRANELQAQGLASRAGDVRANEREIELAGTRAEEHARAAGLSDEQITAAGDMARRMAAATAAARRAQAEGADMAAINDELWMLAESTVPGTGGTRARERSELADELAGLNNLAAIYASDVAAAPGTRRPGSANPDLSTAIAATEAVGSFSGAQISGFGVMDNAARTARAAEELVELARETNAKLDELRNNGGILLA